MRYKLKIFVLFFILLSCSDRKEKSNSKILFTTRHLRLNCDTTINSIVYYNGYYILGQDNGEILILDTNYNRQDSLERIVNKFKARFLFTYHDTVFILNENKAYFIVDNFKVEEFKRKERIYGKYLFEDSSYYVYGCCAGEWGGSVFFLDKKSNNTYSYFATCPRQVLRYQHQYVVCNNLAHLDGNMSFLFIKDPTKLYELTDEKLKNHCNWYTTIDSLRDYWEVSHVGDVKLYHGPYNTMSLITFEYQDSLYSIVCNDTATLIAVHIGDTIFVRDTILKRNIAFHQTQVIEAGKRKVCLYSLTGGSPVEAYRITGKSSGFIIVNENNIDILTKHKN